MRRIQAMPPTLHPYLKRGLDFDASTIDPRDLVEDLPAEHRDAQNEPAKRRRVEAIALQYLRGGAPLILTARLKGPFNSKEWQNPWAEKQREGMGGPSKQAAKQALGQQKTRSTAPQVPSPEASRALGHTEEQLYSQPDLEPLPATALIPDDDDQSGPTEFFSIDTEQFIANKSPTNPFWLRRPATNISFPTNSQTDMSPSRVRQRDHRYSSRKSLQLALPKEPLEGRQLPIHATPPDEWRSSASASMDISSPATAIKHQALEQDPFHTSTTKSVPDSSRLREDSAQEEEARSSQVAQYAQFESAAEMPTSLLKDSTAIYPEAHLPQPPHAQSFDSLVPATTYKMPSTIQVPQSSPTHGVAGAGRLAGPLREEIQRSAERFVGFMPRSTRKRGLSSVDRTAVTGYSLPQKQRHDLVASPAPDSSTGFMYRRVGQPKGGTAGQKAKPRAVSSRSSSPAKKKDKDSSVAAPESIAPVAEVEALEDVPSIVVADAREESIVHRNEGKTEVQEGERQMEEQQESYRSRQSQYSTQAAMLLAQLEFQEDSSQSLISSLTPRPWSQQAQNTPPALLLQPSPAITPLSVFNAHTDLSFSGLAGSNVSDGPPISTQDLFDAASPFAFSTAKKKSQRPRRTSMRFALTKLTESTTVLSPTPLIERVPLKEKNTSTTWSVAHERSSMNSLKAAPQSPQRTTNDVELPQLDFHTSLDFGPNADFTDYFLKDLNNQP
ncbi:uncharacterized protein M421DRAFT_301584 [Didymella exigua CBS 183.55]|uniref:Uncharacterized protein n=1 Tax=Didymella exigua CBS 183.55 TaxID=1150837 RepID=A0A6A5RB92_9PLEO|nr:uncharacterized protein M421DRAFT_301584 [Didymella exigua CBS 183.55]KAF1923936.1 hypothetical protein M421DRAFT_301584 [Didymella exigua CBS 183.55]